MAQECKCLRQDETHLLTISPESGGTFTAGDGVTYRWKTHKRRFRLVKVDDEDKIPLAEYHPYKRHFFVFRMSHHAWLEVKPEAAVALEKVIGWCSVTHPQLLILQTFK